MDVITHLCFGKDIKAVEAPDFKAPLVEALHNSTPAFTVFRHFSLLRKMVFNMPPKMSIAMNPDTKGLIQMQQLLSKSITEHVRDPHSLDHLTHSKTIYHVLLDSKEHKEPQYTTVSLESLFQESQALIFGGGDTTANVIMDGLFHITRSSGILGKLKAELENAWPNLDTEPTLKDLERLPYLVC
jgi:cytochrome P450